MKYLRTITILALLSVPVIAISQVSNANGIRPRSGQPAADVLASHDLWGNPTFIGGITNKGPDSQSTW